MRGSLSPPLALHSGSSILQGRSILTEELSGAAAHGQRCQTPTEKGTCSSCDRQGKGLNYSYMSIKGKGDPKGKKLENILGYV